VSANPAVTSPDDLIAQLTQKLQRAELKIQLLEEKLRLMRIAKYGPGSEKLSDGQLELLELEPGVSGEEVQAESKREALPRTRPATGRKHLVASNCRQIFRAWKRLCPVARRNESARNARRNGW